jgi:hypothetical protein
MKYIGLMFVSLLVLGGMNSVAMAGDAQEALFAFPDLEQLRQHDVPKVVRVRFSEDIDRKTFSIWLNGKEVSDGVDPLPGEREVSLPFEVGRNEVIFSARRVSRPAAIAEEARFTVRYRPAGDVIVRGGRSVTLTNSPEIMALIEEMIAASRAGDNEKALRLRNELMDMEQQNK